MYERQVVLCSPVRTAIGTYGGTLKETPAVELGASAIRAALDRSKLAPDDVGTVVMSSRRIWVSRDRDRFPNRHRGRLLIESVPKNGLS